MSSKYYVYKPSSVSDAKSRPSSAGIRRSTSGGDSGLLGRTNLASGHGHVGSSGSHAAHKTAAGSTRGTDHTHSQRSHRHSQSQRPSSAGHTRQSGYQQAGHGSSGYSTGYGGINVGRTYQTPSSRVTQTHQHKDNSTYSTGTTGGTGAVPGYARPKSAGASRSRSSGGQSYPYMLSSGPHGNNAASTHTQTSDSHSQGQQGTRSRQGSFSSKNGNGKSSIQSEADRWSSSYKLHYGYADREQSQVPQKHSEGSTNNSTAMPVSTAGYQQNYQQYQNSAIQSAPVADVNPAQSSQTPSQQTARQKTQSLVSTTPAVVKTQSGRQINGVTAAPEVVMPNTTTVPISLRSKSSQQNTGSGSSSRPSSSSGRSYGQSGQQTFMFSGHHAETDADIGIVEDNDYDDDAEDAFGVDAKEDTNVAMHTNLSAGSSHIGYAGGKGSSRKLGAVANLRTNTASARGDRGSAAQQPKHAADDEEEMDGKQIPIENRSHNTHPETSTHLGSSSQVTHTSSAHIGLYDGRSASMDTLTEDVMDIGLTTVPNEFCTVRDAVDLRKMLLLSTDTRGGMVPSSTAVMDMYMVGKVIGVGSYGKVRAAWHRLTGQKVAIKTYDKSKLKDPAHWKRVNSEIKITEQVSHPRIARTFEAVETPKRMHLIMECLDGGNLCSYVKQKKRLSEEESKGIFFQVLQAIEHLHSIGVSHRDIKLENVLFANSKEVKLIDFGFSTFIQDRKKLKVFCGTPSYMAPEIVRRMEYDGFAVDMWSIGIFLYALLCGCFPFRAKSYPDLYRRIARGSFTIPDELSGSVKDLLNGLLNVDAGRRTTAQIAIRHPWLQMQLAHAPDVNRQRLETPLLISDRAHDDLDDETISELVRFGVTREELVRQILGKIHSALTTSYYLLLDHVKRRRKGRKHHSRSSSGSNSNGARHVTASSSHRPLSANATNGHHTHTAQGHNPTPMQQWKLQMQQQQMLKQQQLLHQQHAQKDGVVAGAGAGIGSGGSGGIGNARPRSASAGRVGTGASQRPLSAYAGRR